MFSAQQVFVKYEFFQTRFKNDPSGMGKYVDFLGVAKIAHLKIPFCLKLIPTAEQQWTLHSLEWDKKVDDLDIKTLAQKMAAHAARLLATRNIWPVQEEGRGARLSLELQSFPDNNLNKTIISLRPDMLSMRSDSWQSLWEQVEGRVVADDCFRVQGFDKIEILSAVKILRLIFPSDWIKASLKRGGASATPTMATELPHESEFWFPACHLARTALGALCVDPAWNYLIEIASAIKELEKFPGLERLKRQLTKNPGTQHHLCLAAELHSRGYLVGLEPSTGVGSASNDLLAECEGRRYAIEVKEFTSKNPVASLKKEIEKKVTQLPKYLNQPVIFHVVLRERGMGVPSKEDDFSDSIDAIRSDLNPKISAVVFGRRFVDGAGGRVKRDVLRSIVNPSAQSQAQPQDIETLFSKNYSNISYPIFGIGNFVKTELTSEGV